MGQRKYYRNPPPKPTHYEKAHNRHMRIVDAELRGVRYYANEHGMAIEEVARIEVERYRAMVDDAIERGFYGKARKAAAAAGHLVLKHLSV